MDALKAMWQDVPPASPQELAGARQRLLRRMRPRRRVVTGPRLLVAAGVAAGLAVTPLISGTGTSAYAVAKSPDGTVTVTVNELRDPSGLEAKLAEAGVKADVTFLGPDGRCAAPRFVSVDRAYDGAPAADAAEMRSLVKESRSFKATQVTSVRTIQISPRYIKPGETLVVEFRDNRNPHVPWRLGAWLAQAGTPVQPCTPG
ncbi:hypothetical protein Nocox_22000 [Nonomuraea coxensis DSM 45129]|uniref:Uncharacterized protein n=1 Tax=Nonomuraea coxensis DSM 45129 TaxID=1122611 RepID=A0ABX8U2W3_9ACTN|nr:hypothetical protein [Nonomuraea coxensis]QYC42004.1 hypothetical protein Nocox_22000 [Nonomuraea coxensis DSM 45129]